MYMIIKEITTYHVCVCQCREAEREKKLREGKEIARRMETEDKICVE